MAKINIHKRQLRGAWVGTGLVLLFLLTGHAREVRIPVSEGQPGSMVQAPVVLDDATEVACVKVQVNYDTQLLTLLNVTNPTGTLGSEFSLQYETDGGRLILILYREDQLVSGSGVLAYLNFLVNPGAEYGVSSELVIADLGLGSERGKDLEDSSVMSIVNGSVWGVMSSLMDSDGDGLSDYMEQRYNGFSDYDPYNAVSNPGGRDLDVHNSDSDGDGVIDGQEILSGTDPIDSLSVLRMSLMSVTNWGQGIVLQWSSVTGKFYSLDRATNLLDGFDTNSPVEIHIAADPPKNTYSDASATNACSYFYRVRVE